MKEQNKKYAKYGLGALGIIALYYLFTGDKSESGTGANDPFNNGVLPNNSVFNAKYTAELLYDAMKDSGTDEAAIFNALQGINEQQFRLVAAAFGNRSYNTTLGNQYNLPSWMPGYSPLPLLPLRTWLKEELSKQNYETLRLKYINSL